MDIKIKLDLKSVRVPHLNGSEEFKKNESFSRTNSAGNDVEPTAYKLLQLPETLVDVLNLQDLNIKGNNKNLYLTTNDQTFQLKQNFHSNCVLLLEPGKMNQLSYSAYTTQQSELELISIKLPLDTSFVPDYIYPSESADSSTCMETIYISKSELISALPISIKEFELQWKGSLLLELPDLSIKKIPPKLESEILDLILVSVVSLNMKYTEIDYDSIILKTKALKDEDKNMALLANAVLDKYTNENKDLKMKEIAMFYGLKTLKQKCPFSKRNYIEINDFYMYWKESLPSYFNCDLDIDFLIGYFAKDLVTGKVLEIDPKRLPTVIQKRVSYLMDIQRSWDQKHIQPFFEELNEQGIKPENFIMKFARRKREKNGIYIVTQR